jgi:hypothetical protein
MEDSWSSTFPLDRISIISAARPSEVKVGVGGRTMVHAKVRIDDTTRPIAIDYLNLDGKQQGTVSRGIMEWIRDDVRFLIAPSGAPRPTSFTDTPGTLSRWRRRAR